MLEMESEQEMSELEEEAQMDEEEQEQVDPNVPGEQKHIFINHATFKILRTPLSGRIGVKTFCPAGEALLRKVEHFSTNL